jgi:hypothetical protein
MVALSPLAMAAAIATASLGGGTNGSLNDPLAGATGEDVGNDGDDDDDDDDDDVAFKAVTSSMGCDATTAAPVKVWQRDQFLP